MGVSDVMNLKSFTRKFHLLDKCFGVISIFDGIIKKQFLDLKIRPSYVVRSATLTTSSLVFSYQGIYLVFFQCKLKNHVLKSLGVCCNFQELPYLMSNLEI